MDISSITQDILKGLAQKNYDQLIALSRTLNLIVGKTLIATVSSTQPVTPAERDQLLQQTTAALTALKQQLVTLNHPPPTLTNEIGRLIQQQQLIQSPALKWVTLIINNQALLTYSDRPLEPGKALEIQLQTPQKLVIVESGSQTNTKTINPSSNFSVTTPSASGMAQAVSSALTANQNGITNQSEDARLISAAKFTTSANVNDLPQTNKMDKNLAAYAARPTYPTPLPLSSSPPKQEIRREQVVVTENLRKLLPQQDTRNLLFAVINKLEQLPRAQKQQILGKSLEEALKSAAEHIRTPHQLSNPKILAHIIKNSGLFFENKLASINKEIDNPKTTSANNSEKNLTAFYAQDKKGATLNLLNKVTIDLAEELTEKNAIQTNKLPLEKNLASVFTSAIPGAAKDSKALSSETITELIQHLLNKPLRELTHKELRTQLLALLQQHTAHSLNKIQLQQLQSLSQELEVKETAQSTSSWQLDIPVKHHNDIHHLHLYLEREWIESPQEHENKKNGEKIKQWSVTLSFDLPTLGEFSAQLSIINTHVRAVLWAERENTFTEVRQHIEGLRKQLESEGIVVKQLQCIHGKPPQKPRKLSYSLIDIST